MSRFCLGNGSFALPDRSYSESSARSAKLQPNLFKLRSLIVHSLTVLWLAWVNSFRYLGKPRGPIPRHASPQPRFSIVFRIVQPPAKSASHPHLALLHPHGILSDAETWAHRCRCADPRHHSLFWGPTSIWRCIVLIYKYQPWPAQVYQIQCHEIGRSVFHRIAGTTTLFV
ncbi:uncharacterized protein BO72DRAFT_223273 [Aspergillus fijiensis CBS 313.89]|uniref:Uncharacterized protein n=1 Tax=Aspergillus fijiensis CBS 313.89 TaxID=1448319 RepID=A0A8G1RNV0_9EURO|nr:uncharacterized protein BO72DRAFT_223273 [Aspergillus fijiensis CBS 313.89]RAK73941.1 hypothetical protein BO72DRAFT_223273 [Aspergillus fijiensis CBS 313.89]